MLFVFVHEINKDKWCKKLYIIRKREKKNSSSIFDMSQKRVIIYNNRKLMKLDTRGSVGVALQR